MGLKRGHLAMERNTAFQRKCDGSVNMLIIHDNITYHGTTIPTTIIGYIPFNGSLHSQEKKETMFHP